MYSYSYHVQVPFTAAIYSYSYHVQLLPSIPQEHQARGLLFPHQADHQREGREGDGHNKRVTGPTDSGQGG